MSLWVADISISVIVSLLNASMSTAIISTYKWSTVCCSFLNVLLASDCPFHRLTLGLTRCEPQWSAASVGCFCSPSACGRGAGSFSGTAWVTWRPSCLQPHLAFWEAPAPGACAPWMSECRSPSQRSARWMTCLQAGVEFSEFYSCQTQPNYVQILPQSVIHSRLPLIIWITGKHGMTWMENTSSAMPFWCFVSGFVLCRLPGSPRI